MKTLLFLWTIIMSAQATNLKIVHYNIKELDTSKIKKSNPQLEKVKRIIQSKKPDLVFFNEIQYDFPGVPNNQFKTEGKNLEKLNKIFDLKLNNTSFYPANTGKNARKNSDGEYFVNPMAPGARQHADQVNFGIFPYQYSSGFITSYKILEEKVISTLSWKSFNPKINISQFTGADGSKLPQDMELFDKNFTDVLIEVDGKKVHIITLHTVPSYHFGNDKTPNYERNRDQLRFLEWYLTGSTDIKVNLPKIKPIKGESFIAAGDWNVGFRTNNAGASVMQSILKKTTPFISEEKMDFTNEGAGFGPKPFRLMLDYLVVSNDLKINSGEIMHPNFERVELGCNDKVKDKSRRNFVKVKYANNGKTCYALIHKSYIDYKDASDHYPIFAEVEL